jgi:hypothetical protein
MGKLGVVGLTVAAVVVAALLPAREAGAQDFGQAWIDRITHELERERGPLEAKPVTYSADVGVEYAYDSNIFLTKTSKKSDSIIIPFVQANIAYGEPRFDIEASLLADYKYYIKEDEVRDDEERVYFRARQTSSRWNFEISQFFQNVSDPAGLQFLARVSRVVANTIPKVAFDIGKNWAMELNGNAQIVRYQPKSFTSAENNNFTVDFSVVYRTPWAFDVLAQFGYLNISYTEDQTKGGTPDAFGYYYRAGFRGHLTERLYLEAVGGWQTIESDFFVQTGNSLRDGTGTGYAQLRYEATEKLNFFFDASRIYGFVGFGDPYQLINSISVYGSYDWTEKMRVAVRLFWEHSNSALQVSRSYYGASLSGNYKILSHLIVDGGVTYRGGQAESPVPNSGPKLTFNDFILSVGIAYGF